MYLLTLLSSCALIYGVLVTSKMLGVHATFMFSCKRLNEEHDQGTKRMVVMGLSRSCGQSLVLRKRPHTLSLVTSATLAHYPLYSI